MPNTEEERVQREFQYACVSGDSNIVQELLNHPLVDPAKDDQIALREACRYGNIEIIRLLLTDSRVDPSAHDQSAIRWAIDEEHTEVVRLLLCDPRVNPEIAPEKASILETIPSDVLHRLIVRFNNDWKQIIVSINHLIEKQFLQSKGKTIVSLKGTQRDGFGNLSNNLRTHIGHTISGKIGPTLQNHLHQLKGNYYGPANQSGNTKKKYLGSKRRTRKRSNRDMIRNSRKARYIE